MDPPAVLRRSIRARRSGSSRRQALRKFFPAFRGWASSGRFRSATDKTGKRASAPGAGSASSRAIRATAGCAALYSPPSRGSATSRRVAGRRPEAPAAPEAESETPPSAAAGAGTGGNSPCGCDTARARRFCNGLLRGRGLSPWQPCSRLSRSYHSFVPTPVLLADYSGMRMRGTTFGGKAEAGATAILGVPASGVKNFLHPKNKSVKSGIPLEFPCGNRLRALRAVQPRRAGFPLAVRLAKWRTLAGERRVSDLDPAGIRLRALPVPGVPCRPPKAGAHQNGTRPYEPDSPLFESGVTNRRRRGGGL